MARRTRNPFLSRSFQRALGAVTRSAMRAGSRVVAKALRSAPATPPKRRSPRAAPGSSRATQAAPANSRSAKAAPAAAGAWSSGVAAGPGGARRYRLYQPAGLSRGERLPLLVMLHGCTQDAQALADSSRMNRIAARERFIVLYPEQDRLANAQRCWNWHDTRSGRAQAEAATLEAAISRVCRLPAVDGERIALAGLSAGASMAALLATRQPARYGAVAMHSGIPPGVAHSSVTALGAMRGRRAPAPLAPLAAGTRLPALLVIHGTLDRIVAPVNAEQAAQLWAGSAGARAGAPRSVQRGARYATTVTDYRSRGSLVATLCLVKGLGHAWSGGAARQSFSDPKGPDAARMVWAFAAKQFKRRTA